MKRTKRFFIVATITIGGCLYNDIMFSNNTHNTKKEISIGLKNIGKDSVAIYIEESVISNNLDTNSDGGIAISSGLYALILGFVKIQSQFFSELTKKFLLMKYYSIGQYILFKDHIKKILLRIAKTW